MDRLEQSPLALLAISKPLSLGLGTDIDEAGRNAVDGDAPGAELFRQMPRERDDGRLGRAVGDEPVAGGAQAGIARDVDDATAAFRLHRRRHGLRAMERTGAVDVEDGGPFLR